MLQGFQISGCWGWVDDVGARISEFGVGGFFGAHVEYDWSADFQVRSEVGSLMV